MEVSSGIIWWQDEIETVQVTHWHIVILNTFISLRNWCWVTGNIGKINLAFKVEITVHVNCMSWHKSFLIVRRFYQLTCRNSPDMLVIPSLSHLMLYSSTWQSYQDLQYFTTVLTLSLFIVYCNSMVLK